VRVEKAELEVRFRELSDEELLARFRSGTLTEQALEVASAELRIRGLAEESRDTVTDENPELAYSGELVEVARLLTPTEAYMLEARLHAEGVPAAVVDAHLGQAYRWLSTATGGARVLVPAAYVTAAMEVKAALARGDFALSDDDVTE
jgi:hypothetical protein